MYGIKTCNFGPFCYHIKKACNWGENIGKISFNRLYTLSSTGFLVITPWLPTLVWAAKKWVVQYFTQQSATYSLINRPPKRPIWLLKKWAIKLSVMFRNLKPTNNLTDFRKLIKCTDICTQNKMRETFTIPW